MSLNPELVENDPQLAEIVEQIISRYDRSFDFSNLADQSTFAEAMHELGQHLALNKAKGQISISHGSKGINGLSINVS